MELNVDVTGIKLTPAAIIKAIELIEKEENQNLFLRIKVSPGGCSGLRYGLFFDDVLIEGDIKQIFTSQENSSMSVCVDVMSAPYLGGAIIDFVDTIDKQGFIIDNPNAHGSCACGDSFA